MPAAGANMHAEGSTQIACTLCALLLVRLVYWLQLVMRLPVLFLCDRETV